MQQAPPHKKNHDFIHEVIIFETIVFFSVCRMHH